MSGVAVNPCESHFIKVVVVGGGGASHTTRDSREGERSGRERRQQQV